MNIIFVEPAFPAYQRQFVRGLAEVGATVIGVGERYPDQLDDELRSWMHDYIHVKSVTDAGEMHDLVAYVQDHVWVDRIETTIEAHTLPIAQVREARNIPGTSVRTAWLCRDKPSMKQALREAGVPTAASAAVSSADEAYAFAEAVGFPLILKPRAAAGALDTMRVDSRGELEQALSLFGGQHVDSIAIEEFVEGHEGFYDTLAIDGQPMQDFPSHYYPIVLDTMRGRWISP